MIPLPIPVSSELPPIVRRAVLRKLFRATAVAFRCAPPPLGGLATPELLARYASFTADHAQAAVDRGEDLRALQARLYQQAYPVGRWLARLLGVRNVAQAMDVDRLLYRVLEIDFRGDAQGQVVIERCYFSRFYTADTCRLMSGIDHGVLAGLMGGGALEFQARITEGAPYCLAHFTALGERTGT